MPSLALLVLRLVFGLGIALHGYQSLFIDGLDLLTGLIEAKGWPAPTAWAYAAKITELGGGVLLIVGFLTRWAALACAATMGVAIWMSGINLGNALIPQWESAALYGAAFLALLLSGPGRMSVDGMRQRANGAESAPRRNDDVRPAAASSEAWDGSEEAVV